jgi:hypothetical protein
MKKIVKKTKLKWMPTGGTNIILKTKWGRISYNPHTGSSHLGGLMTDMLNLFGEDVEDGEETALYDGKVWRILTGDFRKEYEEVFPSLKKCKEVYLKYKDKHRNNYSTDF